MAIKSWVDQNNDGVPDSSLSFSEIQTEFGGSTPISLSEYYRGGTYVSSNVLGYPGGVANYLPASGALPVRYFYGATNQIKNYYMLSGYCQLAIDIALFGGQVTQVSGWGNPSNSAASSWQKRRSTDYTEFSTGSGSGWNMLVDSTVIQLANSYSWYDEGSFNGGTYYYYDFTRNFGYQLWNADGTTLIASNLVNQTKSGNSWTSYTVPAVTWTLNANTIYRLYYYAEFLRNSWPRYVAATDTFGWCNGNLPFTVKNY